MAVHRRPRPEPWCHAKLNEIEAGVSFGAEIIVLGEESAKVLVDTNGNGNEIECRPPLI
jgi:hypothetical protein